MMKAKYRFIFPLAFLLTLVLGAAFPLRAQEYLGTVLGVKEKSNSGKPAQNKMTIGEVSKVNAGVIVVGNRQGSEEEVVLDEETTVVGQNKKKLAPGQIKKSDLVAIVTEEETSATPGANLKKALKVYVKQENASQLKRKAVQGIISSLKGSSLTLTHQIHTDRIYSLTFNPQTTVKIKDLPEATVADLQVGQRIVAVGDVDAAGNLLVKKIHVIPGQATGVFNQSPVSATPSAVISPSVTQAPEPSPIVPAATVE